MLLSSSRMKTHSSSKPLAPPVVGHVCLLHCLCPLDKAQLGETAFLPACGLQTSYKAGGSQLIACAETQNCSMSGGSNKRKVQNTVCNTNAVLKGQTFPLSWQAVFSLQCSRGDDELCRAWAGPSLLLHFLLQFTVSVHPASSCGPEISFVY